MKDITLEPPVSMRLVEGSERSALLFTLTFLEYEHEDPNSAFNCASPVHDRNLFVHVLADVLLAREKVMSTCMHVVPFRVKLINASFVDDVLTVNSVMEFANGESIDLAYSLDRKDFADA